MNMKGPKPEPWSIPNDTFDILKQEKAFFLMLTIYYHQEQFLKSTQ